MKYTAYLLFCLILASCSARTTRLSPSGEALFRISYNPNRELSDAEMDSLQKSLPTYSGPVSENKFYTQLLRAGVVSDSRLDTSSLNFTIISDELPNVILSEIDLKLETDRKAGRQYLHLVRQGRKYLVDLGENLPGDRWVTLFKSADDSVELLVLEKYYIMGGDNFDLKMYAL